MVAVTIHAATPEDEAPVVALWRACDLVVSYNDPLADFRFAAGKPNSDILVAQNSTRRIVGAIMVGHDGHRGWVYYVAVDPACRRQGIGRSLMQAAETWLSQRGVAKINLMVRETNSEVGEFYKRLGYDVAPRTNLQKWLTRPD